MKKKLINESIEKLYLASTMGSFLSPESMQKEQDKRIHEEKRKCANTEKESILALFCIDEINDDFLGRGDYSLSKTMSEINNIKKKRI